MSEEGLTAAHKDKSVEEFIADLYCLAENSGYGTLHDELVRDRIVVGIRDSKLSEEHQIYEFLENGSL